MRRRAATGTILILATLAGVASTAPPGLAGTPKRCADVIYRLSDGTIYARTWYLAAYNTTCQTARTVALELLRGGEGADTPRPEGFTCKPTNTRNGNGYACTKGRQQVRWLSQDPEGSADCGSNAEGEPLYDALTAAGVSCTTARRIARRYTRSSKCYREGCRVLGYRCKRTRTGYESYHADCRRGRRKHVTFNYGA